MDPFDRLHPGLQYHLANTLRWNSLRPTQAESVEPILAVVDSLSRTLECIKSLCATAPNGSVRDELETERANLVIGLFVARVAAMRVSLAEAAPEE